MGARIKKFLTIFFVTLGVLFFVLILVGVYLYVADPLHLRSATTAPEHTPVSDTATTDAGIDKHPFLSPTQEKALETIGVDPAQLPSSITPAQRACFVSVLGAKRVAEITAGDAPTMTEFVRARSCIE